MPPTRWAPRPGAWLPGLARAARSGGALVLADVLHPGSPRDFEQIAGLLAVADWFLPNSDQLLALTGRSDITAAVADVLALGTGAVAVTLGADGCLVRPPAAGSRSPGPRRRCRRHDRLR